jgi:CopG family transcriptional regulator, nickel-responsive regulator
MQRVTITLDDDLMEALDGYMRAGGHANRSEAIRDLVRVGLEKREVGAASRKACVGALVYVYDHETRRLAERLTTEQHAHHDMSVATLHVHLDEHKCMEVAVLKGPADDVRHFADHVIGERGVQYGQLVTIPADGVAGSAHGHSHGEARPRKSRVAKTRRT